MALDSRFRGNDGGRGIGGDCDGLRMLLWLVDARDGWLRLLREAIGRLPVMAAKGRGRWAAGFPLSRE